MENSELLERFLPGYRIVCRIFARHLGIDLTDLMMKAFVIFALWKSTQYIWAVVSGVLASVFTTSVQVPRGKVHDDVLAWVGGNVLEGRAGRRRRVLRVAERQRRDGGGVGEEKVDGLKQEEKLSLPLSYEPAFDSPIWFVVNWRVIFLRRQKTVLHGEMILLTCISLTTEPLRDFLRQCVESADHKKMNGHATS